MKLDVLHELLFCLSRELAAAVHAGVRASERLGHREPPWEWAGSSMNRPTRRTAPRPRTRRRTPGSVSLSRFGVRIELEGDEAGEPILTRNGAGQPAQPGQHAEDRRHERRAVLTRALVLLDRPGRGRVE